MMNKQIDVVTRQNPKNFTQQLQQRNVNRILANNLVKIKPMVDTKMPASYKQAKQQQKDNNSVLRQQNRLSQFNQLQSDVRQERVSLDAANAKHPQYWKNSGVSGAGHDFTTQSLDDPLYRYSSVQQQPTNNFDAYGGRGSSPDDVGVSGQHKIAFDPVNLHGQPATWQNGSGRGPNDSLMSVGGENNNSLHKRHHAHPHHHHQNSQHQAGGSQSQGAQPATSQYRMNRVEKERQRQIDNENTILLNKMIQIMNRKQNKEQGLVRVTKAMGATQSSSANKRHGRQALSQPDEDTNFAVGSPGEDNDDNSLAIDPMLVNHQSHYMSDASNRNFQSRGHQRVTLAPKLVQSAAISAKPASHGARSRPMQPPAQYDPQPDKAAMSSGHNRHVSGAGGFQVHYLNNPRSQNQTQPQMLYQIANSAQVDPDQSLISATPSQYQSTGGQRRDPRQRSQLVPMPRTPGTLNFSSRKKQIQKINQENLQMLKTLQQTKPTTSYEQWREHAKRQQNYRKNISMAPASQSGFNSCSIQQQQQSMIQNMVMIPNSLSQIYKKSHSNQNGAFNNGKMTIEQLTENPVREFLRSKVKSGSLPTRANFYVHNAGSNQHSKKAYSMQNGAQQRAAKHQTKRGGGVNSNTGGNRAALMMQHQQMLLQKNMQQPDYSAAAIEDSTEVAQKIESVINMFPLPTEEQLEQFKELQESNADLNPASSPTIRDPNTITNIQLYKGDQHSEHQVENFNLDQLRSLQNHQMVSQPNVEQAIIEQNFEDPRAQLNEQRRVKTTMPGNRIRQKGNSSITIAGQNKHQPYQDASSPEKDPDLSMRDIQKPQSMEASMNSQSQVPQIIVRRQGTAPDGQEFAYQEYSGCNPMLIPIQKHKDQQFVNQQAFYHPQEPAQYQVYPDGYQPNQSIDSNKYHQGMQVPRRSFYDYQYDDGPDYKISFDKFSGQPIINSMDAITMNTKLLEMQSEIAQRMMDDNVLARQNYIAMKEQQASIKKKNVKQIIRAYAQTNQGPYGTNNQVLNQLQNNSRKVPLNQRRKNSNLRQAAAAATPSLDRPQHQTQADLALKPKLRAGSKSPSQQRASPPRQQQMGSHASQLQQPRAAMKPMTSNKLTRPRVYHNRPSVVSENNDDQVGGGPVAVSPEILRLQANRPDERQQRNRRRVFSPPTSGPESTAVHCDAESGKQKQEERSDQAKVVPEKPEPVPKKPAKAAPVPQPQPKATAVAAPAKVEKAAPQAPSDAEQKKVKREKAQAPEVKDKAASLPKDDQTKAQGLNLSQPAIGHSDSKVDPLNWPDTVTTNAIPAVDQAEKDQVTTQSSLLENGLMDDRAKAEISQDQRASDQRASSTIEEGIMGLKYLPQQHQQNQSLATASVMDNHPGALSPLNQANGSVERASPVLERERESNNRSASQTIVPAKKHSDSLQPDKKQQASEGEDDNDEDAYESDTETQKKVDVNKKSYKALTSQSQVQSLNDIEQKPEHRDASGSRFESQKTKKVSKQSDSPRVVEEDQRRINSTLGQHVLNPVATDNRNKQSRTAASNSKSNTNQTAHVTHQETQLGLHEPHHIEYDHPIKVDQSDQYSAVTEKNAHEEAAYGVDKDNTACVEQSPEAVSSEIQVQAQTTQEKANKMQPSQKAKKSEALRQSAGSDGAYSDFEEEQDAAEVAAAAEEDDDQYEDDDEGERAAVGSGIVETNENYDDQDMDADEDDYEDIDGESGYQDLKMNHHADASDSAGEISLKDNKKQDKEQPQGQIAQLVQQRQMPLDSEDEVLSDEEIVPGVFSSSDGVDMQQKADNSKPVQHTGAANVGQPHFRDPNADVTDSEEAYSSGDFNSNGDVIRAAASKAVRRAQQPVSDDEDDDDYADDDDQFDATAGQNNEENRKMSLESDQEADENEFEQIKDEDYVDEDDEQYSNVSQEGHEELQRQPQQKQAVTGDASRQQQQQLQQREQY